MDEIQPQQSEEIIQESLSSEQLPQKSSKTTWILAGSLIILMVLVVGSFLLLGGQSNKQSEKIVEEQKITQSEQPVSSIVSILTTAVDNFKQQEEFHAAYIQQSKLLEGGDLSDTQQFEFRMKTGEKLFQGFFRDVTSTGEGENRKVRGNITTTAYHELGQNKAIVTCWGLDSSCKRIGTEEVDFIFRLADQSGNEAAILLGLLDVPSVSVSYIGVQNVTYDNIYAERFEDISDVKASRKTSTCDAIRVEYNLPKLVQLKDIDGDNPFADPNTDPEKSSFSNEFCFDQETGLLISSSIDLFTTDKTTGDRFHIQSNKKLDLFANSSSYAPGEIPFPSELYQ